MKFTRFLFDTEADNGGGADTPSTPDGNAGGNEKTFTQAQLDKMFAPVKAQAAEAGKAELLKALGVESLDDLQSVIKKAKDLEDAQLSELDKAKKAAEAAELKAQKAEADKQTVIAQANERLMKAAVITASQSFNDPNDAWLYIDRSKIEMTDDGEFTGVDEAVKAVAEQKPYLLKADGGQQPTPGTPKRQQPRKLPAAWQNQGQPANGQPAEGEYQPTIRF